VTRLGAYTGSEATLSVPVHSGKTVKRGTLNDLIKDAGLTSDEFVALV
jgi:predicted RNA binding protein YcfA (HicA-like mRNA interferase family)